MCFNSTPSPPPPPPLKPALPAPKAPPPAPPPPKQMQAPDAAPDIKIGATKPSTGGARNRGTTRSQGAAQSLSIGDNQGMSL